MSSLFRDLRIAVRHLSKSPGFVLTAVLMLALGIGANTAIFSVVNSLLLRPLPLYDPSRLVSISVLNVEKNLNGGAFALRTYEMMRDGSHSFSGVTAASNEGFTLLGNAKPERLAAARVAPNFMDVLGARPLIGRGFLASEGLSDGPRVVLISQSLWQRRFGDLGTDGRAVSDGARHGTIRPNGLVQTHSPFTVCPTNRERHHALWPHHPRPVPSGRRHARPPAGGSRRRQIRRGSGL